jgi:hypothetical protein
MGKCGSRLGFRVYIGSREQYAVIAGPHSQMTSVCNWPLKLTLQSPDLSTTGIKQDLHVFPLLSWISYSCPITHNWFAGVSLCDLWRPE